MKKEERKELEDVGEEIEQLALELQTSEYKCLLYEQDLASLLGKCWSLALQIERTVLSEDERKEYEANLETMFSTIKTQESKVQTLRESTSNLGKRLENVRRAHQSKSNTSQASI